MGEYQSYIGMILLTTVLSDYFATGAGKVKIQDWTFSSLLYTFIIFNVYSCHYSLRFSNIKLWFQIVYYLPISFCTYAIDWANLNIYFSWFNMVSELQLRCNNNAVLFETITLVCLCSYSFSRINWYFETVWKYVLVQNGFYEFKFFYHQIKEYYWNCHVNFNAGRFESQLTFKSIGSNLENGISVRQMSWLGQN